MVEIGEHNRFKQQLIRKTEEKSGNHPFARLWDVKCCEKGCGYKYKANGCDFHVRHCPKHDGGKPASVAA